MTLREAIEHYYKVAEGLSDASVEAGLQERYSEVRRCTECAKENFQLAKWLDELEKRREKEAVFRPEKLYAIEHINTGKIIFNARGGAYKKHEDVEGKLKRLGEGYRIVVYTLEGK